MKLPRAKCSLRSKMKVRRSPMPICPGSGTSFIEPICHAAATQAAAASVCLLSAPFSSSITRHMASAIPQQVSASPSAYQRVKNAPYQRVKHVPYRRVKNAPCLRVSQYPPLDDPYRRLPQSSALRQGILILDQAMCEDLEQLAAHSLIVGIKEAIVKLTRVFFQII